MHIGPIISSLKRHRAAVTLIVFEIALTCAIVSNAVFLITQRLARINHPTGVTEEGLLRVRVRSIGAPTDARAITAQDLAELRAIPGVKYAAASNIVPLGRSAWNGSVSTIPDDPSPPVGAALFMGSERLLATLGVALTSGRDFSDEEYVDLADVESDRATVASVIVTRRVADALYPGQDPLGKPVYAWGREAQLIVGVIEELARPSVDDPTSAGFAVVLPVRVPYTSGGNYLLRTVNARSSDVLAAAEAALRKIERNRIITNRQTFSAMRKEYFQQDSSMVYLLAGLSVALLTITALGIVGLASFWVQQRTRQIGIRRALGATRGDILAYFQTENLILSTMGVIVGMGFAYAINLWLMKSYHVAHLPAVYLSLGGLLIVILGQFAVLGPAIGASSVSPAEATRAS